MVSYSPEQKQEAVVCLELAAHQCEGSASFLPVSIIPPNVDHSFQLAGAVYIVS